MRIAPFQHNASRCDETARRTSRARDRRGERHRPCDRRAAGRRGRCGRDRRRRARRRSRRGRRGLPTRSRGDGRARRTRGRGRGEARAARRPRQQRGHLRARTGGRAERRVVSPRARRQSRRADLPRHARRARDDRPRLRAHDVARRAGAEALLASSPSAVAWLTGFAAEIDSGPNPFSLPPLALLAADDAPVLIVSDDDAEGAAATGCDVHSYRGFSVEPIDAIGGASRVLAGVVGRRRVGIEAGALPAALAADLDWMDVDAELARARAVKDPDELSLIRAAIELCDVGQREARLRAEPGLTELELWAHVRGAIESAAGARTPILAGP